MENSLLSGDVYILIKIFNNFTPLQDIIQALYINILKNFLD